MPEVDQRVGHGLDERRRPADEHVRAVVGWEAHGLEEPGVYAPDAPISYAGNSDMSGQGDCLRLVGKTVQMTGNSSVRTDCAALLGNREMYAGRLITLAK